MIIQMKVLAISEPRPAGDHAARISNTAAIEPPAFQMASNVVTGEVAPATVAGSSVGGLENVTTISALYSHNCSDTASITASDTIRLTPATNGSSILPVNCR